MREWVRNNKLLFGLFAFLAFCTIVLWTVYTIYSNQFLSSIYNSDSNYLLKALISSEDSISFQQFIAEADKLFYNKLLFGPLATFLFYFLLIRLYQFVLRSIENRRLIMVSQTMAFKYDTALATIIYILVTLLYFYPYLSSFSSYLIGPLEDNIKYLWNIWWGYKAFFGSDASLTFSNYIFYPEGSSLLYNDYSWYNLIISFPLKKFFTLPAVYNLLILHSFLIAGLGTFLLIRYLTGNSIAAITGGLIFAFNPSHIVHSLHHINIASIQFIPFFILCFIKSIKQNSKRQLLLASLFFLLNAACDWNYMIFNIYFILFSYIYLACRRKKILLKDVIIKSSVIISSTVIVFSPWIYQMILLSFKGLVSNSGGGYNTYVADILTLITPFKLHLLSGSKFIEKINTMCTGNYWENTAYLGMANIVICLIFLRRLRKEAIVYIAGFLVFVVISMGTFVHFAGNSLPVILPYSVVKYIPLLLNARAPSRLIVLAYLFFAIITSYSYTYLIKTTSDSLKRAAIVFLLYAIIIADYYPANYYKTEVTSPECYNVIDRGKTDAILDLPGGWVNDKQYMMYQTFHEIPIVGGTIPRKIGYSLQDNPDLMDLEKQKQQLITNNIKYIVIHKNLITKVSSVDFTKYSQVYSVVYNDNSHIVLQTF